MEQIVSKLIIVTQELQAISFVLQIQLWNSLLIQMASFKMPCHPQLLLEKCLHTLQEIN